MTLNLWQVDPLVKVFKDSAPAEGVRPEPVQVAVGEVAEWQLVVNSDIELAGVRVRISELFCQGSSAGRPKVRFPGYVPVDRTYAEPASDLLRQVPCEYPDPLFLAASEAIPANTNQPIWIDLPIRAGTKPGVYSATVTIEVRGEKATIELQAAVRGVTAGKSRLWVTNWFNTETGYMPGSNSPGTEEEESYLGLIARSMAAHRQNVAIISPLDLSIYGWDSLGALWVDFSRFDTWVRIFMKAGVVGRIEGGHLGARVSSEWESQFGLNVRVPENGTVKMVAPDSAEAESFYSQFLPQLVSHLKKRRWLGRYLQHLADEPIEANVESYRQMAALVRKYAPELRIIEATHTHDVEGCIDVWVPQLNFAADGFDFYKARQEAGDEFWTYTCIWPEGEYANRFIELPLIKTRLLHWINFRYGITGYLHWGFNYWVPTDPFDDLTRTKAEDGWNGFLPAGDSWIVYPKDGVLLDSIRFEAMRDGIADYELLSMLADRDAGAAHRLAERLVLSFNSYNTDVVAFRQVRRELLDALEAIDG